MISARPFSWLFSRRAFERIYITFTPAVSSM